MIHKKVEMVLDNITGDFIDIRNNLLLCARYVKSDQGEVKPKYILHITDTLMDKSCLFHWAGNKRVSFDDDGAKLRYRPNSNGLNSFYVYPDLVSLLESLDLTEFFYLTLEPVNEDT